jgi:shikimate kinase
MRICLIGMPGSGKSLIGRKLADTLNLPFFDTDTLIGERFQMSIPEIFVKIGEDMFRQMERDILDSLLSGKDMAISTGGGLPAFFDNMYRIKQSCCSIYLKLSEPVLLKRLGNGDETLHRPLLKNLGNHEKESFIIQLLKDRSRYYEQADIIINADESPEQVIKSILYQMKDHLR